LVKKIKMKKILVLGGTGFIGSHFINSISKEEIEIFCLGKKAIKKNKNPNINIVNLDISHEKKIKNSLPRDFTHVLNLSGYIDHSNFYANGRRIINEHFIGLMNIISHIDKSKLISFVNIGSSDQYWSKVSPMKESYNSKSFSCYSLAKNFSEDFLKYMHKFEDFPSINVRLFLVYGPNQKDDRFLPHVIKKCLNKESFNVSPGNQLRDFCFIDDVIDALRLCLDNKKAIGQTINIASGNPISIKEVVKKVVKISRGGKPIFGGLNYRENEQMSLFADNRKANSILGWKPKVSLDEGLKKTVDFFS
tara:strand:- start:909 stop:1826 length:918 start_codon:yes stop_codon:yes gene_type:complete